MLKWVEKSSLGLNVSRHHYSYVLVFGRAEDAVAITRKNPTELWSGRYRSFLCLPTPLTPPRMVTARAMRRFHTRQQYHRYALVLRFPDEAVMTTERCARIRQEGSVGATCALLNRQQGATLTLQRARRRVYTNWSRRQFRSVGASCAFWCC